MVEPPEFLHGVEGVDGVLVLLPGLGAIVSKQPHGPRVLLRKSIQYTVRIMDDQKMNDN